MRNKSIWILAAAVCVAGYSAYSKHEGVDAASHRGAPSLSLRDEAAPGASAATDELSQSVATGRAREGEAPVALAAPAASAIVPARAAASPGSVARYAALLASARKSENRVDEAIYSAALVRSGAAGGEPNARSHALTLEGDAVRAANRAAGASDASTQRKELTIAYLACLDGARRARYEEILVTLAEAEVLSPRAAAGAIVYEVQPGDSLARIGKRYTFPVEGLMRVNRLKSDRIRIGQSIKVPRGVTRIVVCKGLFRLAHLRDERLVAAYAVGIGKDDSTPEASFTIADRQVNPTWFGPNGVFPPGDPGNLLGVRWLGFKNTDEHNGFGIHGTVFPESIGQARSSGCIRLVNDEVVELFGYVERHAVVTIVR